jgi:hypothetical protein
MIGEKKKLNGPAFEVGRGEYEAQGDRSKIDIPFLNGTPLARKERNANGETVWSRIDWDTRVSDGDTVLLIPKVQGS